MAASEESKSSTAHFPSTCEQRGPAASGVLQHRLRPPRRSPPQRREQRMQNASFHIHLRLSAPRICSVLETVLGWRPDDGCGQAGPKPLFHGDPASICFNVKKPRAKLSTLETPPATNESTAPTATGEATGTRRCYEVYPACEKLAWTQTFKAMGASSREWRTRTVGLALLTCGRFL